MVSPTADFAFDWWYPNISLPYEKGDIKLIIATIEGELLIIHSTNKTPVLGGCYTCFGCETKTRVVGILVIF